MACCRPESDDPNEALSRDYSWCELLCKTFGRDFSALAVLIRAKTALWKYIRKGDTIPTLFTKTVQKYPHKTALVMVDGKSYTFQQVDTMSNAMANYIIEKGYQKDDVVALFMENTPQFAIFWLGLAKAGVIASLINFNLIGKSLLHCIEISKAKGLIYSSSLAHALSDIKDDIPEKLSCYCTGPCDPEIFDGIPIDLELKLAAKTTPNKPGGAKMNDILLHIYTSGTTGLPKAAIITHTRFYWGCDLIGNYVNITPDDVVYDVLPLYHSAGGILGLGLAFIFGTTIVIRKKFSASNFWEDCVRYNCTYMQYIGEICRFLLSQPRRPWDTEHKVKTMYGNGLRVQIWKEFVERFKIQNVRELYGATEGNCNIINTTNRIGAVGFCTLLAPWAYPICLIKVDPETDELVRNSRGFCIRCKPGEPGQMIGKIIKGDPTRNFDGYLANDATKDKVARDVFSKGDIAFLTGDIMVMDGLGYCYFRDRTGDTFRWRGENVSTQQVEADISSELGLVDAVVFGVEIPGSEGKAGMAAIVDNGRINMASLYEGLSKRMPIYSCPLFIRLLKSEHADMTSTFKLQKTAYRAAGYDPKKTNGDPVYNLDPKEKRYVLMTTQFYESLMAKHVKW